MRYIKIIIAIIGLFKCNFGFGYDFEVDGIYYNKLSDNEVEVTSNRLFDHNTYSGNIIIPSEVFYSNITYKVTSIGYRAMDSQNISNVELPNTIVSIGEQAFMGCDKITSLYIPSSVKNIGNSAFYLCDALESIELPDQVTNIGTELFSGCKNLKYVKLPSSLDIIPKWTFSSCNNLESISLPQYITTIEQQAFYGCSKLTDIELPNSLQVIGVEAFYGCGFTSIILPASLTSIGDRAFRQDVKEVHSKIKEPFETLAFSTSSGGHHDRILYVPSATKEKYVNCFGWGNYFREIIEESETYSLQITATGNGSATYNSTAVRGKTQAFTVNEGSSAKVTFAPDAGYRIASVKVNGTDVTSNVANNQYTISNISTNTTLKVMFDVGLSDGDVFTAKTAEGVDMTFKVISTKNKTCQVGTGKSSSDVAIDKSYSGPITIPTQVNGYSVTSIGDYAFFSCSSLTGSLIIPNSVTSIGESAFFGCSRLTGSLSIPNSVTSIGNQAFFGCGGLTGSLTIPNSVTSIGDRAFYYCRGFTGSLTIPNSVISIGRSAFEDCSGLTGSLNIPNSVTSIGDGVFSGCSGFTGSLTIPYSVTSIGEAAFENCIGFTGSLTIPNSVTSIGAFAFYGCSGLTSITIPNSVASIGSYAFSYCI